ncbi:MAG: hypothetical protein ABIJ86_07090 [Spirochaetota bacterium]
MRCFAALIPPASFLAVFEKILLPSISGMRGWRPVRPEGIHVTLAFMADAGQAMVDAVVATIQGTATRARAPIAGDWATPVTLRFGFPRLFPSTSRPKVLAIEPVQGADELAGLWNGFNGLFHREALARGLPPPNPEWRPGTRFRPHLSLARPATQADVWQVTRPVQAATVGSCAALDDVFIFDELVLYESILGSSGSRYTPLAHASLTGGA